MADTLTLNLTDEELKKVNSKKKDEKYLPKIYDKVSQSSEPISRDFEAFLILEDFSFKDKITDKIKAVLAVDDDSNEKDLFDEALENEMKENDEIVAECTSKVSSINELRVQIQSSKFSDVTEISRIFSDVLASSSKIELINRLANFRANYLNLLKDSNFKPSKLDEKQQKQTESWLNPLTAY